MKRVAIFASGGGSNALKILEHFEDKPDRKVSIIVTNKKNAGVLTHAIRYDVPSLVMNKSFFYDNKYILEVLESEQIDLVVLAGFLWLIPEYLVKAYPNKIVNIHPALLPKYGGKGMYGKYVHQAVKAAGDPQSGITIHFVNEVFDDGEHIFQASCEIENKDTPEVIAKKVLALEHANFPRVIDEILSK